MSDFDNPEAAGSSVSAQWRPSDGTKRVFALGALTGEQTISLMPDWARLLIAGDPLMALEGGAYGTIYERVETRTKTSVDVRYEAVSSLTEKLDDELISFYASDFKEIVPTYQSVTRSFSGKSTTVYLAGSEYEYSVTRTGNYFLEVVGTYTPPSELGLVSSNRFLVAFGNPSGQRSQYWGGDWVNTVVSTIGYLPDSWNAPGDAFVGLGTYTAMSGVKGTTTDVSAIIIGSDGSVTAGGLAWEKATASAKDMLAAGLSVDDMTVRLTGNISSGLAIKAFEAEAKLRAGSAIGNAGALLEARLRVRTH